MVVRAVLTETVHAVLTKAVRTVHTEAVQCTYCTLQKAVRGLLKEEVGHEVLTEAGQWTRSTYRGWTVDMKYLQRLTLGMDWECQMTRRLVTIIRPRSPELPFQG